MIYLVCRCLHLINLGVINTAPVLVSPLHTVEHVSVWLNVHPGVLQALVTLQLFQKRKQTLVKLQSSIIMPK